MAKIAIMGHGVVGSGVAEVMRMNAGIIAKRTGEPVALKRVLDLREFPDAPYAGLFTKDFNDILNDPEISVVAETMGGMHPAYEFTLQLLQNGKSVVTSNKELVAQKGDELLATAREHNCNYMFEASVGGGIPIIRPLHQCLAGNKIEWIQGILNGTTNFIMTKMITENMSFSDALALAQKLGYAEKDPSADVDGSDACRKICILASLAYGSHVYPNEVHQYGISDITLADVAYASAMDGVIKLIGRAKLLDNGKISMMVCPAVIPKTSKLATVNDVFNAVLVKGNAVGEVLFVGAGAGALPTASAVVGDIIDCVKAHETSVSQTWEPSNGAIVSNYRDDTMKFYLRLHADDTAAAKAFVQAHYADPVFLSRKGQPAGEIAFKTGEMVEQRVKDLTNALPDQGITQLSKVRVLD